MFCIKGLTDRIGFIFYVQTNTFLVTQKAAVRHMQAWCTSGLKHTHHAGEEVDLSALLCDESSSAQAISVAMEM